MIILTNNFAFSPRQFSKSLWLDGSDPLGTGTPPANLTSLSAWVDKSGQGNDFAQASGSNQPVFMSSVFGNLGSPKGDALSQYMSIAYTASLNSSDITLVCVFKSVSGATFQTPFSSRIGPTTFGYNIYQNNGGNRYEGWTGQGTGAWSAANDGAIDTTKSIVIAMRATGGTATWYKNGVSFGSTTYVPNTTSPSYVFANESAVLKFAGYVNEIIIVPAYLNDANFFQTINYCRRRWGAN